MPEQIAQHSGTQPQPSEPSSSAPREGFDPGDVEADHHAVTDWREHVRERPELWLGVAFVGGMLVAAAFRTSSGGRTSFAGSPGNGRGSVKGQALEFWHNMQGALVGVASARIREYIDGLVPGFHEHYRQAEQQAAAGGSGSR